MSYVRKNNNSSTATSKSGNFLTTISEIGTPIAETQDGVEVITGYAIKKGDYGFTLQIKFGYEKFASNINFNYFKASLDPTDYYNYLNNNAFKVQGIIQMNEETGAENERQAIRNYTEPIVAYMTDLLSVYTSDANKVVRGLLRDAKFNTPFFTFYGNYEGDVWQGDNEEPTTRQGKGENAEKTYSYGKVNNISTYLHTYHLNGVDYLFYETDRELIENGDTTEAQLEWITMVTNLQMEYFFNSVIQFVIDNNKGNKGYVFRTWQEDKKKNYYLKPVVSLKSLVISRGTVKVGDKYISVIGENKEDYPEAKYWYGGILGLTARDMYYKVGEETKCRLQFAFRSTPFNESIEGLDELVSYRGKGNPKLLLGKPVIEVEDTQSNESHDNNDDSLDIPF